MKKVFVILGIVFLLVVAGLRYYEMAEYRGCGYNPIKHITASECYCMDEKTQMIDGYAGFRCGNCQEYCNQEVYRR